MENERQWRHNLYFSIGYIPCRNATSLVVWEKETNRRRVFASGLGLGEKPAAGGEGSSGDRGIEIDGGPG